VLKHHRMRLLWQPVCCRFQRLKMGSQKKSTSMISPCPPNMSQHIQWQIACNQSIESYNHITQN